MTDIFTELFGANPLDPNEAVRRNLRPNLPRRFFKAASVGEADGAFRVLLDGRPARTPARQVLAAPARALASAICAEWEAQAEHMDPARMPLTRLANAIIDGVADAPGPVRAEIEKYLASDLLFYRASGPQELRERQARLWDPILRWAKDTLGADFKTGEGIVHIAQPAAALEAASAAIPEDGWRLGALNVAKVVFGPGEFGDVNGNAAAGGEPCEGLILGVEIVVIAGGIVNINGQLARAEVRRRQDVVGVIPRDLAAHGWAGAVDGFEKRFRAPTDEPQIVASDDQFGVVLCPLAVGGRVKVVVIPALAIVVSHVERPGDGGEAFDHTRLRRGRPRSGPAAVA